MIPNRLAAVIAASAIGLSLLAGCQTAAPKATGTQSSENAVQAETPAPESDNSDQEMFLELDLNDVSRQIMYGKDAEEWELPMTGCILTIPDSLRNLKGQVFADDVGETDISSDVFHCRLFYVPSTDQDREALADAFESYMADGAPDESLLAAVGEAENKFTERGYMPFLDILVFNEMFSLDQAKADAWISEETAGQNIELGQKGPYKYYCLTRDYSSMAAPIRDSFTDEYYDEFMTLVENAEQLVSNITATEPRPLKEEASDGAFISFETTDLDGNTVKSEDLFAGHKVTMINIWTTWCGPCVEEMPGLEELNKELAGKNCQIIGICDDTADDIQAIEEAKAILKEKGVTYTNLVQTEEMRDQLPTSVYPISYFVDSEGRVLASPELGANLNAYSARIDKILVQMTEVK